MSVVLFGNFKSIIIAAISSSVVATATATAIIIASHHHRYALVRNLMARMPFVSEYFFLVLLLFYQKNTDYNRNATVALIIYHFMVAI